jgi:putative ABC transport system permease protein
MLADWLHLQFGLSVQLGVPSMTSWSLLLGLLSAAVVAGLLPAVRAYRLSLADGLNPPHLG